MSIFQKLFGGGKPKATSLPPLPPLRSPSHPAHTLVLEAADLSGKERIEIIDRALAVSPQDANLLYAKVCTLCEGTVPEKKLVPSIREQLVQLRKRYPDHIDIRMKEKYLDVSYGWEDPINTYPNWSEKASKLDMFMPRRLEKGLHVQLVSHCLTVTMAMVYGAPKAFCDKIDKMRWDLRWVKTPYGFLAVHYVIIDSSGKESYANECFLPPGGVSNPPGPMDSYWLLKRLAQSDHCFLVFSDDGDRVLRNELFVFPEHLKETLAQVKNHLDKSSPVPNPNEFIRKASKWYMDNNSDASILNWINLSKGKI